MCTIPATDSDDPPTDTDEEVTTDASEEPPCLPSECRFLVCQDPAELARPLVSSSQFESRPTLYQNYLKSRIELPRTWCKDLPTEYRIPAYRKGYFPFNEYLYKIAVGDKDCDCTHVILTKQSPHTSQRYFDWPCGCSNPVIITKEEDILKQHNSMNKSKLTGFTRDLAPTQGCIICPLRSNHMTYDMYVVPSRRPYVVVRNTKRRCTSRLSLTDRKRYRYGNNRQK